MGFTSPARPSDRGSSSAAQAKSLRTTAPHGREFKDSLSWGSFRYLLPQVEQRKRRKVDGPVIGEQRPRGASV